MSDENPWKPGDVVRVKSGGPPMTVAGEDTIGRVICEWFVGSNQKSGVFNASVLEKHEPQKASIGLMRS
jgi:uncharacterized protein YodC (DUF2158 family)